MEKLETEIAITSPGIEIIGVVHDVEDQTGLARTVERLQGADCVILENLGGTDEQRAHATDVLNAITDGQYADTALDRVLETSDDYALHLVAGLRKSGALILLIDVAEDSDDPAWQAAERELNVSRLAKAAATIGDKRLATKLTAHRAALTPPSHDARERRMAEQIAAMSERLANTLGEDAIVKVIVGEAHAENLTQSLNT